MFKAACSSTPVSFTVSSDKQPTFEAAGHNQLTANSCENNICSLSYEVPIYTITVTAANADTVTYCKNLPSNCPLNIQNGAVVTKEDLDWVDLQTPLTFLGSTLGEPTFTSGSNTLTAKSCDRANESCILTYYLNMQTK